MLIKKKINSEEELLQSWTDDRVPFIEFMFNERSIYECEYVDGEYYASYYVHVVTDPTEVFWTFGSEAHSTIVEPGTYGFYK
jgi:hypothetical protein